MNLAASPQAYRESAILTAPPERLVVMLYDGARRFLHQAAAAMSAGQIQVANERLRRGEAVVEHLLATLDMSQGEIPQRLEGIYLFCLRLLGDGRIKQDPDKLETASRLLGELRDAWSELAERPKLAAVEASA